MWVRNSPKGLSQEQVGRVGATASSSEPCRAAMDFQFFFFDGQKLFDQTFDQGERNLEEGIWAGRKEGADRSQMDGVLHDSLAKLAKCFTSF